MLGRFLLTILAVASLAPCAVAEAPSPQPALPELMLEIPWGADPGQAGKREARESSPEGPMSFALSSFGELCLLDQVNGRILVYGPDLGFSHEMPLPGTTFQDLEFFDDNHLVTPSTTWRFSGSFEFSLTVLSSRWFLGGRRYDSTSGNGHDRSFTNAPCGRDLRPLGLAAGRLRSPGNPFHDPGPDHLSCKIGARLFVLVGRFLLVQVGLRSE